MKLENSFNIFQLSCTSSDIILHLLKTVSIWLEVVDTFVDGSQYVLEVVDTFVEGSQYVLEVVDTFVEGSQYLVRSSGYIC